MRNYDFMVMLYLQLYAGNFLGLEENDSFWTRNREETTLFGKMRTKRYDFLWILLFKNTMQIITWNKL